MKIVLIQCLEPKASFGLWSEHFSLSRRVFSFRKLRHLKIVLIKQIFFRFQFLKFFKKLLIGRINQNKQICDWFNLAFGIQTKTNFLPFGNGYQLQRQNLGFEKQLQ